MNAPSLTTAPSLTRSPWLLLWRTETRAGEASFSQHGKAVKAAGGDALTGAQSHAPAPSLSSSLWRQATGALPEARQVFGDTGDHQFPAIEASTTH